MDSIIGKDILCIIAMKLELPDLFRWCISSNKIYKDVFNNDNFWRNRLMMDYPNYGDFNTQNFNINCLSLKKAYIFLYQLTFIKKLLNSSESEYNIFLKENLNLSEKGLTKVPSFNLPNLKILFLNNNLLEEIPSFNLPNLRRLVLSYNQLKEVPAFNLPNLETLYAHNNQLKRVPAFNLPKLNSLDLAYNELTEIPSFNLPNLKYLDLGGNSLVKVPSFNLPNLQLYL